MKIRILLILLFMMNVAQAHPVIYKGGTVLSSESHRDQSELHIAYTFYPAWALGLHSIQEKTSELDYFQLAHLIQRWNNEDSQANIYMVLGLGAERKFGQPKTTWNSSQMVDLMMDWENRDYYIQGMQRYIQLTDNEKKWHSRLRLGLAPFKSDTDDLGIWGIVQFDKMNGEEWTMTNLLRFYFKNVLWEVGARLDGSYQINLMLHL